MRSLVPWPIRRIFRAVWWLLCICTIVALPLVFWEFQKQNYDVRYQAWFVGGIFVILSFPISMYEVAMHTEYYTQPALQRHVIRILWMVPIYGVDAWFALRFTDAREYLDPIRECYEAYVIWSFLAYLTAYLEGTVGDLEKYRANEPPVQHSWGTQFFVAPWKQGGPFLWECRKGVLNYVILRPVVTVLQIITTQFGVYGQGEFNFGKAYIYLSTVTSVSQGWSLYCLIQLYRNYHEELRPIRPLSKFLCVKAVIFLSFWQGVVISGLVSFGIIGNKQWTTYDERDVAGGIQNFLICIEMFLAALAHTYAFPPRDYMDPNRPTDGFFTNVRHMFDFRDVVDEVHEVLTEHFDTANEGLHTVAQLPQQAIQKAAGYIRDRTHKSGSEPSSDVDAALLDIDDAENGDGTYGNGNGVGRDDGGKKETLPHIANLDILPHAGHLLDTPFSAVLPKAGSGSGGGSPPAAVGGVPLVSPHQQIVGSTTADNNVPPAVAAVGSPPRRSGSSTVAIVSRQQQRPSPDCHRLSSDAGSFVSASESSMAQMESGALPSFVVGQRNSFGSFGSAASSRFVSASPFQPPPIVHRGSDGSGDGSFVVSVDTTSEQQQK